MVPVFESLDCDSCRSTAGEGASDEITDSESSSLVLLLPFLPCFFLPGDTKDVFLALLIFRLCWMSKIWQNILIEEIARTSAQKQRPTVVMI